ncbi:MAG TPA: MraY family glycosyltransferase [Solirubrobacteraceae bacterium]|jgi:UDP-GlcNAc:undecaprenyl-phosphate GlcNAc-1-phosphate transferase|nr:MraY family glycosyltransferase [Solirubrobacteraceae bacterium]
MSELDALFAFLTAAAVSLALTPLTARLARRVGAIDDPRDRGLSVRSAPLLGGLAIMAGALVAGLLWLPSTRLWHGVLGAAAIITLVGALDDRFDLPAGVKLGGQVLAAGVAVHYGIVVNHITLPFVGVLDFPRTGTAVSLVALVGLMNIVNFSDGVDGLTAGVCVIIASTMAVIAFDVARHESALHNHGTLGAGVLAGIIAGGSLGFLFHNFPPAKSFMGDSGSNLLGLLMGAVTIEGAVKTQIVVSFAVPLILLAVPFMDTTFVVLKRLKYRRPIHKADAEHFHHRMARIGFSQRRTVVYLYGWTVLLAGLALALRFVPYSDHHGHLYTGWSLVLAGIGLVVISASVYLIYVLEILKFRRITARRLERTTPGLTAAEIDASVVAQLETGEFQTLDNGPSTPRAVPGGRQEGR